MSSSVWLTRAEAAAYIQAPSLGAFDHWVRTRGVRAEGRRGRMPLYTAKQLDAVLRYDATRRASSKAHLRRPA